MDTGRHELMQLFAQLGLDNSQQGIDAFVRSHALAEQIALADAPFWNASQAHFLRQSLAQDAEWAEAVDTLSTMLTTLH